MAVTPIPDGYPQACPYLIVDGAADLLRFVADVFGGKEVRRHASPDGQIMHAETRIGDALIMVGGAGPNWPAIPAAVHVYVEDVDATYARALKAGATSLSEPTNQFYGDRNANVKDASGTTWFISSRIEELSDAEMDSRRPKI